MGLNFDNAKGTFCHLEAVKFWASQWNKIGPSIIIFISKIIYNLIGKHSGKREGQQQAGHGIGGSIIGGGSHEAPVYGGIGHALGQQLAILAGLHQIYAGILGGNRGGGGGAFAGTGIGGSIIGGSGQAGHGIGGSNIGGSGTAGNGYGGSVIGR